MSMIDITKIVFPEDDSSGLQQKLFKIVDKYFENLSTHDLEEIYELQKNKNIKKYTFSLKTTYQAITIRNSILENFEKLQYVEGLEKEALLNIVVVGGGPTGVELAGAFAEIKRDILPKDFFRIDFTMKKRVLTQFLAKQNFKKIVKMYDVLIDDGSSYSHVYIPLFAPLIIEKVTEQESLETIKTACYPYNNHAKQLITEKIEEKLDIKFNFEE